MEKISITCIYKTHTMYQKQTNTKINEQSLVYGARHTLWSSPDWMNSQ